MPDASTILPVDPLLRSSILRKTMVDCQVRTFDVTYQPLLALMLEIPRERFLNPEHRELAYSDKNLQVKSSAGGGSRWLLPPFILARLIQESSVTAKDKVLDIASGTGYSTALLAGLAKEVTALESEPWLLETLRHNLDDYGLTKVKTLCGPLPDGAGQEAPFDLIFINGAVEGNLDRLAAQLTEGGRLVALEQLVSDNAGIVTKAVRFEKAGGVLSPRRLFDAAFPVLDAFRKQPAFTFA
jgi:protein-L-isoaspartate(D-aspartate) O-methyltransferase